MSKSSAKKVPFWRRALRGWGLLETAISMAVIGGLTYVVWSNAAQNNEARRLGRAQDMLLRIVQNTRNAYWSQTTMGTGDITAVLVAKGNVFPSDTVIGGTPYNPWDGAVTVTGNTMSFYVSFAGLPAGACMDMASSNTGVATDMKLVTVRVGSTDITTFPITPTVAESNCSGTSNTIRWEFKMRG